MQLRRTMDPRPAYDALVQSGAIDRDPAQAQAVDRLQRLANQLARYAPRSRWSLGTLLSGRTGTTPRGVYIHGAVGRGKTLLMDLLFNAARIAPKRRLHFQELMAEAHDRMAKVRARHPGDPLARVSAEIARTASLLCLDELQVEDIADAMILARLFQGLLAAGVVIVATSNTAPRNLYRDGLNRQLFLPFVDLIERHCVVLELAAERDYRRGKLIGQQLYFTPDDAAAVAQMDEVWHRLTGDGHGEPHTLEVKGHKVPVPMAALGMARFTFAGLCGSALGSNDYLAVARTYHTVLLEHVPVLGPERRNEARRLITLIDALYDHHVRLIVSAAAEPDLLYAAGDGSEAFKRTASRLIEMRSEAYLAAAGG